MNELDRSTRTRDEREQAYIGELLLALRMRGVSGPRIAEALAEVSSHLSETGEDPVEAFGPAKVYAEEVVAALGEPVASTSLWSGLWSRRALVYGVGGALGAHLTIEGVLALAAGGRGLLGLPASVCLGLGLVVLAALAAGLVRLTRVRDDQVLDPRSGADMAPPLPRWALPLMLGVPALTLALAVLVGLAAR
jgi:hypothetical protein